MKFGLMDKHVQMNWGTAAGARGGISLLELLYTRARATSEFIALQAR